VAADHPAPGLAAAGCPGYWPGLGCGPRGTASPGDSR
jgi:hypothetical protein